MPASVSTSACQCVFVCVCALVCSVYIVVVLKLSLLLLLFAHSLINVGFFFVFLLSSVRACTPVIVACFALSLLLSLCFDSWRSLRRDLHLALALSLPNSLSLALSLPLRFSCLSAFIAPCGGASKQFEIYFLYYLFVLFESKLNHRLME